MGVVDRTAFIFPASAPFLSVAMQAASSRTTPDWEALRSACEAQAPTAGRDLTSRLMEGFALVDGLDLETIERTVCADGSQPPRPLGPDQTQYLRWLLEKLCALTMEDGLTGLFNRRYFDHRVRQELQRASRERRPCSVMIVDADHFKRINDSHGHAAGDEVLRTLGQVLCQALRTSDDVTTRFGGEEFAVILPGTDRRGAAIAAERLRAAVDAHGFAVEDKPLAVTVSVGTATYDPNWAPISLEDMLRGADDALYKAKEAGRNCVRSYGQLELDPDDGVTAAEKDALFR